MKKKSVKLRLRLSLVICGFFAVFSFSAPYTTPVIHTAWAAAQAGPVLSIPSLIPAAANSTVAIPVQFASNGNGISSVTYSVNYDETWLSFDPSEPLSITVNLPPDFVGGCTWNQSDADGELDCYALDPAEPLMPLPDQVIVTIMLVTKNAPHGTVAPVVFSADPQVSFGDIYGQSTNGTAQGGSVLFTPPPDAPSNLTASATCNQVSLHWTDESDNESGFRIYRKDCVLCSWTQIGSVGANITSYIDAAVLPLYTYYYKVCAFNIAGESCSNVVSITTNPLDACYRISLSLVLNDYFSGNTISGWVRDHHGSPVSMVTISDPAKGVVTSSAADGTYSISAPVPGVYNLVAQKDGYNCSSVSVSIPPAVDDADFICIPSSEGNFISGRVLDSHGQPLQGVTIADPYSGYHTYTDSGGYYALISIPNGNYHLVAFQEGYICTALFANPVGIPPSVSGKNFLCTWTPGCSDLLVNSGFEDRYGWEIPATEYTAGYSNALAHTGVWSMRTGVVNPAHNWYSWSSARQLITIPGDATRAIVRFFRFTVGESIYGASPTISDRWLAAHSGLFGEFGLAPYYPTDLQLVLILDPWDNMLGSLMWGLSNRQMWTYHQFDLAAYRGRTVKLYFGTVNNGWGGVSSMHIDDVMLDTCR
ncbi:MAG: carboxypeptidase regulatory-like domain-containing protein [Anaerolineales bacterium]|nr:carboxypeptidase regulatory-like domain-containing protein [Anaerolineales bacterium]